MATGFLPSTLRRLALVLVALMAVGALLAIPLLSWKQLTGGIDTEIVVTALGFAIVLIYLVSRSLPWLSLAGNRAACVLCSLTASHWMILVVVIGIVLRVGWTLIFPAAPSSDGAAYLRLANGLLAGAPYETHGLKAYWPPGLPFFLLPWLSLPIPERWAIVCSNLALYAATIPVAMLLARRVGGELVARLATLFLAVWPSYLANAGTPEKENILILLLPLALLLFSRSRGDGRRPLRYCVAAGLTLGFATLVQPSVQLFGSVLFCYEILRGARLMALVMRLAVVAFAMLLVIGPWTVRNALIFHAPVMVSTNGGDNFYRANNPLATGDFRPRGEVDLAGLGEIEMNRLGFRLGTQWIGEHPQDFLKLVLYKQILFLGDDSTGIYNSLRMGGGASAASFFVFKAAANVIWYALWLVSLVTVWRQRDTFPHSDLQASVALAYSYFFVLHSVFESSSKYHLPATAFLAILVSSLLARQFESGAAAGSSSALTAARA